MNIPKDPAILLSYVNTKLRDEYPNLEELCRSMCISREDIEKRLSLINYRYNKEKNCFV